ncbi:hypothetical protein AB0M68_03595 [Streptomyces sp. NPDC051453]|uniref:hypothetical protein n=1 Tax=Streptomyces sp. NPDC051453 TaxID=3154941 RepID=UPI00342DD915
MSTTRNRWLPAAQSADWFQLTRHDDPEPPAPEPAPEPADDPDPGPEPEDPEGADKLGDAGKKALEAMKSERAAAKKAAAAEKKRADELARKVADFEDRDKSELDKATSKAERLEEQAAKATKRAVLAEVRAAAKEFADAEDAAAFLDLTAYTSDDGEIDTEAISADLEALLERKPHLRRAAAEPPKAKGPKPDPGQGPRPPEPPTDFRTSSREELEAELAASVPGFRLRA